MAHTAICVGYSSNGTPLVAAHNKNHWESEWTLGGANWWGGSTRRVTILMPEPAFDIYDPNNYPFPTRDIYYNSSNVMTGEDVKWVQAVLHKLGYDISVDGSFGPASKSVVRQFQNDYGLEVDGSVGPITRQKLYDLLNPPQPVHWYDNLTPVDLGTDFYALILNAPKWINISINSNNNVELHREPSPITAEFVWKFKKQSDGSYKIINKANNKCLDVQGISNSSGANVIVHEDNGGDNQRWYIYGDTNNFVFRAKNTECVLDLTGNESADGTNIQMHTKNNSDAQKFAIYKWDYDFNVVDIGTDFYSFIINSAMWKTISVAQDNNVEIRSERSPACANQVWKFERQWDGSYKIISLANGYCLDVWEKSSDSGANVVVHEDNGGDNQRWYIIQRNGYYTIRAKNTFCMLDVTGFSSIDGTNIQMHTENGTDAQKFTFYKIENHPTVNNSVVNLGEDFTAPLLQKSSWKTLWNNSENNVELKSEKSNSRFLWRFKRQIDGSYKIYSTFDGKCLDLTNSSHTDGTNVKVASESTSDSQRWYIYSYNDAYIIQSKESGKYLDVTANNSDDGTNIQIWDWNGSNGQCFAIYLGNECKFKAPTLNVDCSEEKVHFKWQDVYGETNYILKIWKKDTESKTIFCEQDLNSETTVYDIELPFGDYEALIETKNYYITQNSNTVEFSIILKKGDINFDSKIDVKDIVLMQRYLLGMISLSEQQFEYADYNNDGKFSLADIVAVQRYIMSL